MSPTVKITPDRERSKSLIYRSQERLKSVHALQANTKTHASDILELYYGVIHELSNAILVATGHKTRGEGAHIELIKQLKNMALLTEFEADLMDELRKMRNMSYYEGQAILPEYLARRKIDIENLIKKLEKDAKAKTGMDMYE